MCHSLIWNYYKKPIYFNKYFYRWFLIFNCFIKILWNNILGQNMIMIGSCSNQWESGCYISIVDTDTGIGYLSHFWKKIATVETLRRRVLDAVPLPVPHTAEHSEIDRRLPGDGYNGDESGSAPQFLPNGGGTLGRDSRRERFAKAKIHISSSSCPRLNQAI